MDEGNYTVNPEANGKHNNPVWILIVLLIAKVSGWKTGGEVRREQHSDGENTAVGKERECEEDGK